MTAELAYIYIHRRGKNERAARLYREIDWLTGLSFSTVPFEPDLRFRVSKLRDAGYIVRFDGGELMTHLFTGEPYLKDGVQRAFGSQHVTLYLPAKTEWDAWYNAELSLTNAGEVSPQTLRLFGLRE